MISNGIFLCFICLNLINQINCMSLYQCEFGEYWHTVLERCRPCSDVCIPLTRSTCPSRCKDFYKYVRTSTRTTTKTAEQFITATVGTSAQDTNSHPNPLATGLICLAVISVLIFSISVIVLVISKKKSVFGCLRRMTKVLIRRKTAAVQQATHLDNIGPEQPMIQASPPAACEQVLPIEIMVDTVNDPIRSELQTGGDNLSIHLETVYDKTNKVLIVQGAENIPI